MLHVAVESGARFGGNASSDKLSSPPPQATGSWGTSKNKFKCVYLLLDCVLSSAISCNCISYYLHS